MDPSILWQNASSTVILIDIPRSLEVAQYLSSTLPHACSQSLSSRRRRILSTPPITCPFPSLEPKTPKARANFNARLGTPSIQDLLLRKHVEFALKEIRENYDGDWCSERVIEKNVSHETAKKDPPSTRKTKRAKRRDASHTAENDNDNAVPGLENAELCHSPTQDKNPELEILDPSDLFLTNPHSITKSLFIKPSDDENPNKVHIPPHSTILSGSLSTTLHHFLSSSPTKGFSLINLDPPWPNRSARRSSTYNLARNSESVYDLLSGLPLGEKLSKEGWVAVWVTNREGFREMVLGSEDDGEDGGGGGGGLFEQWSVELVEEWVWIKTTVKGEPICALEGGWRKPWEVLLVGRRKPFSPTSSNCSRANGERYGRGEVKRRIIAGVPDLHSRKPNLRGLFERLLLKDDDACRKGSRDEGRKREIEKGGKRYEALEIFARNLTAGWWNWGDEVVKFQAEECWVDQEGKGDDSSE